MCVFSSTLIPGFACSSFPHRLSVIQFAHPIPFLSHSTSVLRLPLSLSLSLSFLLSLLVCSFVWNFRVTNIRPAFLSLSFASPSSKIEHSFPHSFMSCLSLSLSLSLAANVICFRHYCTHTHAQTHTNIRTTMHYTSHILSLPIYGKNVAPLIHSLRQISSLSPPLPVCCWCFMSFPPFPH